MLLGQAENPTLVLCEIGTQPSRREHANQASGELQFGLCLKSIGQVSAENQVSPFWRVRFSMIYSIYNFIDVCADHVATQFLYSHKGR